MPHDLSAYLMKPEQDCVEDLLRYLNWDDSRAARVGQRAQELIEAVRGAKRKPASIENFFQTYSLTSPEGLSLMALAEALLRVPDSATAGALLRDKISKTRWAGKGEDGGGEQDWLMKIAGLGLSASQSALGGPFAKLGEPLIRRAASQGMKMLGGQFVLGQSMEEALAEASPLERGPGYLFSYDMLGEGARTREDAQKYYQDYENAIEDIGQNALRLESKRPGISVKLSALYPRYAFAQEELCVPELTQKLAQLCRKAANYNICLTVDAEEVDRLETSLKIITHIIEDITLTGWTGFGLAVQAYGKRTFSLIDKLIVLARQNAKYLQIRLVKGAYWDGEIKRAQIKGLADYPVFTRKIHTDLSYLACAQKLLDARDILYPMFGTHNAYTVQAVLDLSGDKSGFEFQRLHGMGEALYDTLLNLEDVPVRIYAPVGAYQDLLPYLVRRMLENGANSSFVNKLFDPKIPPADLCRDIVSEAGGKGGAPHPSIPLPRQLYAPRKNSRGLDLDDAGTLQTVLSGMDAAFEARETVCGPLLSGRPEKSGSSYGILNPADTADVIGTVYEANGEQVRRAAALAAKAFPGWSATPAKDRAAILEHIADLYEENMPLLMALCVREAGKTLPDALAEVREAVDFCRYYAVQGRLDFDENGKTLCSYTGESNRLLLQGRGVFACISPWNFPLAIFTGQVVAALMAGNTVLAKPAEQTPFTAQAAVQLMHRAGVPANALILLPGDGRVGEMIVQHPDIAGVAFTGSTAAAWSINRTLAAKDSAIVPLIAETGGLNAIVADSSALPEQLVDDVIVSAFGSAGQRCSAARLLLLQDDIADKVVAMLRGAMAELVVGDPCRYSSDIGPVIDEESLARLQRHKSALDGLGRLIAQVPLAENLKQTGHYFAPVAYEIADVDMLKEEVFGPILHVVRYRAEGFAALLEQLNKTGYGLTFGLHTRIGSAAEEAIRTIAAGNIYINRSITGAVVGVQPFGGQGLSGTGPKAGGPHYLPRFAAEKAVSVNTAAAGGNASLVMLEE